MSKVRDKVNVMQDGNTFYVKLPGSSTVLHTVEVPVSVKDVDFDAAGKARKYFVENWCDRYEVEPTFI